MTHENANLYEPGQQMQSNLPEARDNRTLTLNRHNAAIQLLTLMERMIDLMRIKTLEAKFNLININITHHMQTKQNLGHGHNSLHCLRDDLLLVFDNNANGFIGNLLGYRFLLA